MLFLQCDSFYYIYRQITNNSLSLLKWSVIGISKVTYMLQGGYIVVTALLQMLQELRMK
jgi:hypothetical protein